MKWTIQQLGTLSLGLVTLNLGLAATTDLADIPLANAPASTVLPNIAFILDDSGSMDEENMPDDGGTNSGSYCYRWYGYNTLYYNPSTTYLPPPKYSFNADGTVQRFANASFTAALKDGYFGSTAKMYDGSTTNGYTDLSALYSEGTWQSTTTIPSFSRTHYVSSVKIKLLDGTTIELLNARTPSNTSVTDTIGAEIAAQINAKTATTGFTATYSASTDKLIITAPSSQAGLTNTPTFTTVKVGSGGSTTGITGAAFAGVGVKTYVYYSTHKTNSASTGCDANTSYNTVTKPADIAAPGVANGSAAALTNYANWYSYYRKRAFLAKAAAGEAFSQLDQDKYRIGLFYINSIQSGLGSVNNDLAINTFTGSTSGTHRANWFDRLYGTRADSGTPLRAALSRAGRMFGGKISGWDPVQYSCQKNFAILTTDGYWNESSGYKKLDGSTNVGDQDGTATRPSYDKFAAQNTLADVAYYYYHTDLRTSGCTSAAGKELCENNVPPTGTDKDVDDVATHQHMTTFTIGLGVNGTLTYQDGYKSSTSGTYFDIKQGTANWPDPTSGSNTSDKKIDDLWHAAVNGRGTYFSAKNAESFAKGISAALGAIEMTTGSGAAAATSNLQPTSGDNYIFIANYRTVYWDGELTAYTIDESTGQIAATNCPGTTTSYCWQVAGLLANKIQKTDSGSILAGNADTRTIKTWSSSNSDHLKNFVWSELSSAEQAWFDNTKLSQYLTWGTTNKAAATGERLVNYLRGHDRNEDQTRDATYDDLGAYYRLYRDREKILGDIVHSQPIYVNAPHHEFDDAGYSDYKTAQGKRGTPTVFVAANDGMLHAFNAIDGTERWAYIPPLGLKNLWRLADNNYSENHKYFIDGPIGVTDVYDASAKAWKTILVGTFGKGGRGVFALDITDPTAPKALWNLNAPSEGDFGHTEDNLGYAYGLPMITKLGNGQWVVVLTSGFNNNEDGDGKGYVFVRDAITGDKVKTLKTDVGTKLSPSGLGYLNIKVNDFQKDNTAVAAYAGDQYGNMWRFDLDAADGTTATPVIRLGASQPISVAPEIGEVSGYTVLYFGTGNYLGKSDLLDTDQQSFYAVKDANGKEVNKSSDLTKITVTVNSDKTRTLSGSTTNWATKDGWYFDLPATGERIHLAAQLYLGTVLIPSTIPTATDCQPGGYSVLYALSATNGLQVKGAGWSSLVFNSPIVGITVAALQTGSTKIYGITADGKFPVGVPPALPEDSANLGGESSGLRVMWRELSN